MTKNPHAVALGRLGGSAGTDAQKKATRKAAAETGRRTGSIAVSKGTQERKRRHAFDNTTDKCWFCKKTRTEVTL